MRKLLFLLIVVITLGSCSEYQKVLKNEEVGPKYKLAEELYKEGKYKKSLRLFEQVVPKFRGKPQAERVMYYYSDVYYNLEDYYLAGYQFERFAKSYPNSDKKEEASYKSAKSYYHLSPRFSLDQTETDEALVKLQTYINNYPDSEHLDEMNSLVTELRSKKEKKAFEIAKQFHHREDYKVAISSFDNYLIDYPGSVFREKALYYKLESQYLLAVGSYEVFVEERLKVAKEYYNNYKKYYKEGEFTANADEMWEDINSRLEKIK